MDAKEMMTPRRGMILSGVIVLLLFGIGPIFGGISGETETVSYTHLRAHETV